MWKAGGTETGGAGGCLCPYRARAASRWCRDHPTAPRLGQGGRTAPGPALPLRAPQGPGAWPCFVLNHLPSPAALQSIWLKGERPRAVIYGGQVGLALTRGFLLLVCRHRGEHRAPCRVPGGGGGHCQPLGAGGTPQPQGQPRCCPGLPPAPSWVWLCLQAGSQGSVAAPSGSCHV